MVIKELRDILKIFISYKLIKNMIGKNIQTRHNQSMREHLPSPFQHDLKWTKGSSGRSKRRMTTLSIDMPMSVLRQKLHQVKERKMQALKAAENRNFLNDIGKRGG